MRAICLVSMILLAVGYMSFVWEMPDGIALRELPKTGEKIRWVRTRDGWEQPSSWVAPPPVYDPPFHPAALAGLQLFISLAALIAFPAEAEPTAESDQAG